MKLVLYGVVAILSGCCDPGSGVRHATSDPFSGQLVQTFTCPGSPNILTVTTPAATLTVLRFADLPGSATVSFSFCGENDVSSSVAGTTLTIASQPIAGVGSCTQRTDDGQTVEVDSVAGTLTLDGSNLDLNLTQTATIAGNSNCTGRVSGTLVEPHGATMNLTAPACMPG
jgi:hypothetical protein